MASRPRVKQSPRARLMFESVNLDQLRRMLPRADDETLTEVLELIARPGVDQVLSDLIAGRGNRQAELKTYALEILAAAYGAGAPRISGNERAY